MHDPAVDQPRPLTLPAAEPDPPRTGLPIFALLTPVLGAAAVYVITRSPFSLAFAAIGPLAAVATLLDGRRVARRMRRSAHAERAARLAELLERVEARHEQARRAAWSRRPAVRDAVGAGGAWGANDGLLVVGSGVVPSGWRVDGEALDEADRALQARAAALDGAPVLAEVDGGIGFVGPIELARAAARAAVVQWAAANAPEDAAISAPAGAEWAWTTRLPHRDGPARLVVHDDDGGADDGAPVAVEGALLAIAPNASALPQGLAVVVEVRSPTGAVLQRADGVPSVLAPELLGRQEAVEAASRLATAAVRRTADVHVLPDSVPLAGLVADEAGTDGRSRAGLVAVVGAGVDGPFRLDLVADGPHALVGGTTGSGKSEFLLGWLAALAHAHPPDRVAFLLVDFKGGAAFAPLLGLPHVTGVVTDLDEAEAERAVASLRAELRHRESVLREAGARDLASLPPEFELARLVVVIDEYQAVVERFPALAAVVADLAARGRSLGVHLVLASQRPNGVVTEQISANCRLRICFRVLQPGDSRAIVGTEEAARLPAPTPGRCVVDRGDGVPRTMQAALADADLVDAVRRRHERMPPARRPWLDPLPARFGLDELWSLVEPAPPADSPRGSLDGSVRFGLVDDPGQQRRIPAEWRHDRDGALLAVGAPGSGRSTALAAIAAAFEAAHGPDAVDVLPARPSAAWDLLMAASGGPPVRRPRLLVLDDLDVRFQDWPDEHRFAAEAAVERLVRASRASGRSVVASVSRRFALPAALREAFGETLLLRHPTRGDFTQAGGDPALWRADGRPGSGQWQGRLVQVASGATVATGEGEPVPELRLPQRLPVVVVAPAPLRAAAELQRAFGIDAVVLTGAPGSSAVQTAQEALGGAPSRGGSGGPSGAGTVVVGSAEAWAAAWQLHGVVRERAVVIVQGGLNDLRVLLRDRGLPPLLDPGSPQCWAALPEGAITRAAWPTGGAG